MRPLAMIASLTLLSGTIAAAGVPEFAETVVDPAAAQKAVYAVIEADVDGDGQQDVVAVTENRVLWYRNPDWEKHVIIEDQTELDNVCIAAHDIDQDGKVDFALGAGWTGVGTLQWLSRGDSLDEPWTVHPIGVERWTHRMRFSNVLGGDRQQLIVSPLNAIDGRAGVRLLAFEIPEDPTTSPWPYTVLDESLNRMHNHWHIDIDGDGVFGTITASMEGVFAIRRGEDGFQKFQLASGAPGDTPTTTGAGEVKTGRAGERPFLATIEPMHGENVVVYTFQPRDGDGPRTTRHVLDDTLGEGHALWTADLDGDGSDELVVGHRQPGTGEVKGPGVYIYRATSDDASTWEKHVLDDGGMACEDLFCTDLNNDGAIDIVAGGRATKNVKIYWNRAKSD